MDKLFSDTEDSSTHKSDALVAILIDCNLNSKPLSLERLHGLHNALLESAYDGLHKIKVARFRTHDEMEVISGAMGHEKVHYLALPQKHIERDVAKLLAWCNESDENIYIKSALAQRTIYSLLSLRKALSFTHFRQLLMLIEKGIMIL